MNTFILFYIVWLLYSIRHGISTVNRKTNDLMVKIKDIETELYFLNERVREKPKKMNDLMKV